MREVVCSAPMHRWSPVNERQRALLNRLAQGEEPEGWGAGEWRSAYALRDRGLLRVMRGGDGAHVQVTEEGTFYLRNGHHPHDPAYGSNAAGDVSGGEEPRSSPPDVQPRGPGRGSRLASAYSERPVARARRAKATDLVERLLAEGRVIVHDLDEDEATEWRRVIDYAKRHNLEPEGKRIEKTSVGRRGVEFSLATGPHINTRGQSPSDMPSVRVPAQLRSPHPVVAALRDNEKRLMIPTALRRRALLLLQGLVSEAVRRGHTVRDCPGSSWRVGEVSVVVKGFACTVTIKQEFPQSADPERSAKLMLELGYDRAGRQRRWTDRKRWVLEDLLGAVLKEIEARAVDEAKRKVDDARAEAMRDQSRREAMAEAKARAVQSQFADALREQARDWHDATQLSAYCDALERRIVDAEGRDAHEMEASRQWLEWARRYVEALDPLRQVPVMPTPQEPDPDELKPHLRGGSPEQPNARRFS
jgi:hypothetical protein